MRGPSECSDDKRLPEIRRAVELGLPHQRLDSLVFIRSFIARPDGRNPMALP